MCIHISAWVEESKTKRRGTIPLDQLPCSGPRLRCREEPIPFLCTRPTTLELWLTQHSSNLTGYATSDPIPMSATVTWPRQRFPAGKLPSDSTMMSCARWRWGNGGPQQRRRHSKLCPWSRPGVPLFDHYTHSQLTDSRGQTPYPGVPHRAPSGSR